MNKNLFLFRELNIYSQTGHRNNLQLIIFANILPSANYEAALNSQGHIMVRFTNEFQLLSN